MRICVYLLVAALAAGTAVQAQSTNPDISVIGDVRSWVADGSGLEEDGELQLDLESVELALQGYLNPFARADVYVGYHDGELELEEAYASILRGLPAGIQLRAGKYRVDFGKLNLLHPHAYSFLDTPLVHQEYLGEEGLIDIGLNLNWQAPIGGSLLTVSGNVLKGDFAEPHEHGHEEGRQSTVDSRQWGWSALRGMSALDEHELEEDEEAETDIGFSERVSLFVPTGEWAGVEVGVNALQGTLDENTGREVRLLGGDVKYRWAPDRFRSLTLQGEWIRSERDEAHEGEVERVESDGFFAFADWRFRQRWNIGAIAERAEHAEDAAAATRRAGIFAGFALMEETTLVRLLLRRTETQGSPAVDEAVLQLVFSLGPHRAHWF